MSATCFLINNNILSWIVFTPWDRIYKSPMKCLSICLAHLQWMPAHQPVHMSGNSLAAGKQCLSCVHFELERSSAGNIAKTDILLILSKACHCCGNQQQYFSSPACYAHPCSHRTYDGLWLRSIFAQYIRLWVWKTIALHTRGPSTRSSTSLAQKP